jgi:hypothetical protein
MAVRLHPTAGPDTALYVAKRAGRNRIVAAEDQDRAAELTPIADD